MADLKFITKILHSKFVKEDPYGSIHMPVYDSVAFEFKTSEEIQLAFERKKPAHVYSRSSNPTVGNFEQKIKAVTDAVGFSSPYSRRLLYTHIYQFELHL